MRREEKKPAGQGRGKKRACAGSQDNTDLTDSVTEAKLLKPSQYNSTYPWQDPKKGFVWSRYLDWCGAKAAPARLFSG